MGLKKYFLSSIVLIIIIAVYAFSLEANDYSLSILGINLNLPIAIWVIIPTVILMFASIFHILFYSFKNMLKAKALQKDEKNIINLIKDILLENQSKQTFKTKSYKDLANILNQLSIKVNDDFDSKDEELNSVVSTIFKVNSKEYVSLKNYKFNKQGELSKSNLFNKIDSDVDFAFEVIKKSDTYSKEEVKLAYFKILDKKSMTTIKKIIPSLELDKEMVLSLFAKDKKDAEFSIGLDQIKKYAKESDFSKNDYINLVKTYKDTFNPDDLIKMFEDLSNDVEEALEAYIYVLIEFEMNEKVREVLGTSTDKEFIAYKALMDLKENGKHYSLETINYNN